MNKMPQFLDHLLEMIYPMLCITCGNRLNSQEKFICMNCWLDLPLSHFDSYQDNLVARLFWGRVQIENATSWFQYRKGSRYQKLIHFIKYKGLKELGLEAGMRFGHVLAESEHYKTTDLIVPVPLHASKLKKRGYNQSEWISRGIAAILQKPLDTSHLVRLVNTQTQTRKSRYERWKNVEGIFTVNSPEQLKGKHILLTDDVLTTGSTLEACAGELLKIADVKVSIATLAFAES